MTSYKVYYYSTEIHDYTYKIVKANSYTEAVGMANSTEQGNGNKHERYDTNNL